LPAENFTNAECCNCARISETSQIPEQTSLIKIKLLTVPAHHLREGISRYTCCQNTLPTSQSEAALVAQQPLPRCGRRQWTNNNQIALYSKLFVAELAHEVGCRHLHRNKCQPGPVEPELNFRDPVPAPGIYIFGSGSNLQSFCLRLDPTNKNKNYCFICTIRLPKKSCLLNGNPNFRRRFRRRHELARNGQHGHVVKSSSQPESGCYVTRECPPTVI